MKHRGLTDDERRARRAAEIAKLGYWDADFKNNILYHSDEYLTVHGLPLDTVVTRQEQIYDLVHPEDVEVVATYFSTVDREYSDYKLDYRIVKPDGKIAYIREIGEAVLDEDGSPVGHTGTSQDITEACVNQQRLEDALREAEETLRVRETFLTNMSHELRTPLNAIKGYAEMMTGRDQLSIDNEKASSYVTAILQASNHLNAIIGDILLQVELGQRSMSPDIEEVNVAAFLDEIANISGLAIDEYHDRVKLVVETNDVTERFDKRLMGQVLINTISNAVKYAGTEHGLEIGYRSEDGCFLFYVQDQGLGLPPDEVAQATTAFFRGSNAKRSAIPGMGLGLALSNQIMKLLGGSITLESESGSGVRVDMVVPRLLT